MYPGSIIRQFVFEAESWSRLIVFLQQENSYFKNRLAEIVQGSNDNIFLMLAEKFQEDLLAQDATIRYLKEELDRQEHLLTKEQYFDGEVLKEVIRSQRKLRKDIRKSEDHFSKIKADFTEYLAENYQ